MTTWKKDGPNDRARIGIAEILIWTGSTALDLDRGCEVCTAYVPVGTPGYPEGKLIISRKRLHVWDREEAKRLALVEFERACRWAEFDPQSAEES